MDTPNTFEEITNYNNYYEFTTVKDGVAGMAAEFKSSPWQVEVYGLVGQARTYTIEDMLQRFTQEERIYRMRCVEGWSMVIPWQGFSLGQLLDEVQPLDTAKYGSNPSWIPSRWLGKMPGDIPGRTRRGCGWMKPCTP